MPGRSKGKNGNGARTSGQITEQRSVPARTAEAASLPAWGAEWAPISRLRDEIETLFNHFFGRWPPPAGLGWVPDRFWDVDVEETDKEILVRAEAPGFDPKDFDIHVSGGNVLTIRAEHKQEAEEKKEGFRSWERRLGKFQRTFTLPAEVDADKVDAHYRNGILEVRLPRTEESQRRRIEVKG